MGGVALVLALSGSFVWLAAMSTVVRLIIYMSCILALPILKKNLGEKEGQFRLPGGMAIPVVALLLCFWLITHASMKSWLTMLGFAALGTVLFWLNRRVSAE